MGRDGIGSGRVDRRGEMVGGGEMKGGGRVEGEGRKVEGDMMGEKDGG